MVWLKIKQFNAYRFFGFLQDRLVIISNLGQPSAMALIAMYPGTFDPLTNGHADLVVRASKMFDKVIVAIAKSARKQPLFTLDERIELANTVLADLPNVEVQGFTSLMVNFAQDQGAKVVIRGLRAVSDFEFEVQLAGINRQLRPEIETVYLSPADQYSYLSSTIVKEVAKHGGDISNFTHPVVKAALEKKLA